MSITPDQFENLCKRIGFAVLQSQMMEWVLAQYIAFVFEMKPGIAESKVKEYLDDLSKKTLGKLIYKLKAKEQNTEEYEIRLLSFCDERNWLIHHVRKQNGKDILKARNIDKLLIRIDRIAEESLRLMKIFDQKLEAIMETRGLTKEDITARATKIMEE